VGRALVRKDGVAKVTGAHRYGADHRSEGELHAAAVFSAHPHAELLSLDISRAESHPGVVAVLTAEDVPGQNAHGIIIPHQPVFVPPGERVRSIADLLALVVAETRTAARAAAAAVDAEYQLLQGVFSPHEALAPGAPVLHPPRPGDEPSNVMYGTHVEKGDVEGAMDGADLVVEGAFQTPFIEHAYLEPESGTADLDENGVVTVRMASQAVVFHHRGVAAVLGLPLDKVRLVHVSPGGGFGARNDLSLHPYLALAALRTGKPVKMVLTRAESLRFHTKRHAMEHTMRLGATRDGRLVALTCDILADTGAYSSAGIPVLDQATLFATGPYDVPNVRIKGLSVYTNNVACGAMRGFGIPQSAFAVESLMDELAEKLGLSPFELRRINGLQVGSSTATGQILQSSVPFHETLDRVEQALAVVKGELQPPAAGHKRGVGVASCYKNVGLGLGLPEPTGVGIDLTPGGRILIRFGGAELGQGADTVVAQMAAQALGVPYFLVDLLGCDTALTPDGGITSASRTTFMSGNAVVEAAPLFLAKLRAAMPDGDPLNPESLARLGERLSAQGRTLSVEHTYQPPPTYPLEAGSEAESTKFISFSYATQAAIIDVDRASGEVFVRKMIAVHDVGRTVNPHGARGQIEGSCLMGLGYAISEEFILDRGYLATDTLAKVGIPVMQDAPPVDVHLIEDPDPHGPYGAKGIAEAAAIPTAPAILNAIHDATGVRIRQLPATPDRVILGLESHAVTT
jgi:CO/xanthine dehydrogenase Mo-binding subunit